MEFNGTAIAVNVDNINREVTNQMAAWLRAVRYNFLELKCSSKDYELGRLPFADISHKTDGTP